MDGKRILIVEDEALVAMLLEDMVLALGMAVLGPESQFERALARAETDRFDAAILDINLNGHPSYAVADVLRNRSIPFAFATGYGDSGVTGGYSDVPVLIKPYSAADVERTLRALLS